ncbi:hypothetical protein DM860_015614 [Cuscuta australis]|uniref:Uncharacterized protein n=1 Tax=Cuscuta australis TaxID=267555 RepID=A0A328DFG3_9ASTE|nr:hypothetical protein DM860_015614 [Cuscuta australis]
MAHRDEEGDNVFVKRPPNVNTNVLVKVLSASQNWRVMFWFIVESAFFQKELAFGQFLDIGDM